MTEEEQRLPEFSCRGETLGTLSNMLKAMHLGRKKDQQVSKISVQEIGLSIVTSKAKSMIARCNLRKDYFPHYNLSENVEFCVDISTLIQVLTIFGISCEFHMEYHKSNDYLRVFLSNVQEQSITECQLFTFAELSEDIPDLRWNEFRIINRLTANSTCFKDIFSEIDALAKDEEIVWFYIKKGQENEIEFEFDDELLNDDQQNNAMEKEHKERSSLTIGVTSDTLQFEGTIPMTYDICRSYEFNQNIKYQFRLSLLRPALRAVSKSSLIRINFNEQNVIQIQHIFHETESHGWVEFVILPVEPDFVPQEED